MSYLPFVSLRVLNCFLKAPASLTTFSQVFFSSAGGSALSMAASKLSVALANSPLSSNSINAFAAGSNDPGCALS